MIGSLWKLTESALSHGLPQKGHEFGTRQECANEVLRVSKNRGIPVVQLESSRDKVVMEDGTVKPGMLVLGFVWGASLCWVFVRLFRAILRALNL